MEKRLNTKLDEYLTSFKNGIRDKLVSLNMTDDNKNALLMEYIYDYNRLTLERDDFVKRKRVKNSIPEVNRCVAKRANGEQCTRRRRDDCEFCGTHSKGTPHGLVNDTDANLSPTQQMEVFAQEIKGIVFYLDNFGNVYKTEDVMASVNNPQIIAKYVVNGTQYTIPEFGLV
jgi:hypothetical protein